MKKRIILIVALLLVALSVGAAIYLLGPKVTARNAIAGVAGDLLDRDEIKPLAQIFKKGSVSFSAEIDTQAMYTPIYGDLYIGEKLDLSLDGKLCFGKNSLFLQNADLHLNDFEMRGDLYIGKKYAYLESDLVGGAVGMIKGEMTDALKSSELAREMPEELYRELLPLMKEYDGISEDGRSFGKSLLMEHLTDLIACVEKNATYQSETREVLLQGEPTKCRVITVTLDGEGIRAILCQLSSSLDDERLCKLIDRNAWLLTGFLVPENMKIDSLSAYLAQRVENAAPEDDEIWTLEIATPRFSSKLLSLRMMSEGEPVFSLDFGRDGIQKTDHITACVADSTYTYSITNHADGVRGASLDRRLDRGVFPLFSLSIDEQNDSFCLFWREGDTERYLMGDWIETKESTTVIAEKITDAEGNWMDEGFHVALTVTKKDSMPRALGKKEVRNLFDLTFDEAWEIITKSRGLWEQFL